MSDRAKNALAWAPLVITALLWVFAFGNFRGDVDANTQWRQEGQQRLRVVESGLSAGRTGFDYLRADIQELKQEIRTMRQEMREKK